ncbi:ABC transporter ATP-binding protein [Albidovulum sp.]|uniref:ABC transporter ATP-binding protein n=1 Tax=Albidovulum sp. TaxID=1872424 RepID=UPI0039B94928
MHSVIQLQNISQKYGNYLAVDDVSVDLMEGEFFALLGPSGCGKTSLLRIVAGFNIPTSGQMLMGGQDLIRVPARKRPINMMFQSYALFPHMTVEQNVRYGLEVGGVDKSTLQRRVGEILETTHLADMARRLPSQLSGGQRQRVALARALVMQPKVLLLDEPLGALDKKLREAMQLELKRLQSELGITFVVVTHDQEEALVMADRIALMKGGKIEQLGSASDLYERPASRFVADFVGRTNFFSGRATGRRVAIEGLGDFVGDVEAQGDVTYSIRPERLRLGMSRHDACENTIAGVVEEVTYHGQSGAVLIRLPGQESLAAVSLTAAELEGQSYAAGAPVWLGWNGKDARVLTR